MKNNHDPENVVFGTASKEREKFIYNDAVFLSSMTIADGPLFGHETLNDIRRQEIPAGENELILRFKKSALMKPILRKYTKAHGITEQPIP